MRTLDPAEEQQLLDQVKQAITLVDDDGLEPDAAVAKVARDAGFGPGKIRLIGYAYNTGRQTAQRQAGGSALDKLAAFPLVDPERVIALVYGPQKTAEARHPDYDAPPGWVDRPDPLVKTAHADALNAWTQAYAPAAGKVDPDPTDRFRRAYSTIERAKTASDESRLAATRAEDRLHAKFAALMSYFRDQFPHDRLPFATVEKAASVYLGPDAVALLGLVHHQGALEARFHEKRGGDDRVLDRPVDLDAAPFPLIAECVKLARDVVALRRGAAQLREKAAATREEEIRPFAPAGVVPEPPRCPPLDLLHNEKAAGIFTTPAIGAAMGTMLSRSIGNVPDTKDDLVNDAVLKLEDPQHQNELRRIRAHAMLNDLMTDPDNPISGHDPDDVLQAYNDLAKLAPRTAEQPAAMEPLLRRRLSGQFEPFESKEVVDIEKGLAGARAPETQRGAPGGTKPPG